MKMKPLALSLITLLALFIFSPVALSAAKVNRLTALEQKVAALEEAQSLEAIKTKVTVHDVWAEQKEKVTKLIDIVKEYKERNS